MKTALIAFGDFDLERARRQFSACGLELFAAEILAEKDDIGTIWLLLCQVSLCETLPFGIYFVLNVLVRHHGLFQLCSGFHQFAYFGIVKHRLQCLL